MTDASAPKPPLGVGTVISTSFRTCFGNFAPFYLAVLLPGLISAAIIYAVLPPLPSGLTADELGTLVIDDIYRFLVIPVLAGAVFLAVIATATSRLAAEASAGRPARLSGAFNGIGRTILPMIVLFTVAYIGVSIAMVFLVLPGVWLSGALFLVIPAIAIGGAGFGGLGRSWRLTKGYRWPIVGLFILMCFITGLMSLAVNLVQALGIAVAGLVLTGLATMSPGLAAMAFGSATFALVYPIIFIIPALTYLRLVGIKDGGDPEALTEVFA